MSDRYVLKWGILATGGIAETFGKDLTVDPATRDRPDISHKIVAAASSSSADRAKEYLKKIGAPEDAKPYGSYKELVADKDVDIIYVATPHSHHFQNVMLCLEAGKNVLCEKALTTNAAQAEKLIKISREKKLFFMEAVWTRYFPIAAYAHELITSGKLGTVERTFADLSMAMDPENSFDAKHRMVNPDLAGGALLDLGIYSLTWVFWTLYNTQKDPKPPSVQGSLRKMSSGVDQSTTMLLTFPREKEGDAHGIATTSMLVASDPNKKGEAPAVRVQGDKGEIQIFPPIFRPTRSKLVLADGTVEEKNWPQPGPGEGSGWYNGFGGDINQEGEGHGMFWEADECAYAIRDGRKEGQKESLEESLVIMKVMDEVRRQGGMKLPDKIETTDYPVDL